MDETETTEAPEAATAPEPIEQPADAAGMAAELERTRAALKAANAESAARRKKLEAYQAFDDELSRVKAELADARAAADSAKAQARQAAIQFAVELEAGKQKFQDPADALSLADLSAVQVADNGAVTGAAEAVKALADKRPYLLKPAGDALGTPRRQPAKTPPAEPPKPGAPLVRL